MFVPQASFLYLPVLAAGLFVLFLAYAIWEGKQ